MASKIEESKAFEKLRAFVSHTLPTAQLRWQNGGEPPDFDLFIDDVEYVVEVTDLRKLFQVGQARLPMRVIGDELKAFVERAERAFLDAGGFSGEYAVVIPRPIPDLRLREPELIERIGVAIQALHAAPLNTRISFLQVDRRHCALLKLAEEGCRLWLYGPTDAQWSADSKVEILSLVNQHITHKAHKMREIAAPRLLVLHDKHVYSELDHFLASTSAVAERESFHTIFVARAAREDVVLTTRFPGAAGVWDPSRAF